MKKAISIILCLSLLCIAAGCVKTASNMRASEWGYFYFPGTDWGMSEEELFSALKIEKADFEFGELPNGVRSYLAELSPFGEKVKTRFDFSTTLISDIPGLTSVQLVYDSNFTKEKGEEIKKKLEKLFKEQNIDVMPQWEENESNEVGDISAIIYTLKSQGEMIDLPQDIKDSYNNRVSAMYDSGEYDFPDLGGITDKDFIKGQNASMSTASVVIFSDGSGYASISGDISVQVAEYSKK